MHSALIQEKRDQSGLARSSLAIAKDPSEQLKIPRTSSTGQQQRVKQRVISIVKKQTTGDKAGVVKSMDSTIADVLNKPWRSESKQKFNQKVNFSKYTKNLGSGTDIKKDFKLPSSTELAVNLSLKRKTYKQPRVMATRIKTKIIQSPKFRFSIHYAGNSCRENT